MKNHVFNHQFPTVVVFPSVVKHEKDLLVLRITVVP